ncbi:MAG: hypothetical protein JSS72_10400 [Armatimonadetes bacterium]|nr:hypothetical protein [Armatimonadota bacterium]
MRSKLSFSFVSAGIVLASMASAEQVRIHLDYTFTSNFTLRSGSTSHLEGPELGADMIVMQAPGGASLSVGARWLLGGKLRSGGDTDGDVYRFLFRGTQPIPTTQLFVFVAGGIAHTRARAEEFEDVNGYNAQLGLGSYLGGSSVAGRFKPAVEFTYTNAAKGQLRGFGLGLSAGF